ncbi:4'-phosphopantetheinyl transferase [Paenibacillus aceti]|uniref:4'-phosphopantetheinyl transferase n=2 Tax=Paenibacillus aceti TaxID=1820010 RepID=A0ABQ1VXS2_9BACL|nr:4'-phosphopantetheinyl transferase superfamily protein [Paenibacillus aceti]GGG04688.1 4'-phosphopantetheinyl transferase [Paenibacillus aceti]
MIQIYMTPLRTNMNPIYIENLLQQLPAPKRDRIGRFTRQEDAYRSLMADILSRWLVCSHLHIKNRSLQIEQAAYGKPMVQGVSELHFNHSHSGQWIVSAISDAPIGIDVERISDIDLRIAERFFSNQENSDLNALSPQARTDYFFELWTLKESYIKAEGSGLSLPLSSFTVRKQGEQIQLDTENSFKHCFFRQYSPDPLHKMAVCAQSTDFPIQAEIIDFNELYERFMSVS